MPGNGSDLSFGALADCQSRHRCSAQIMERDTNNTSPLAGLTPRGTKAIRRPRLAVYGGEDDRERLAVASSAAFNGAPTGITTARPPLDCRNRICLPS